MDNNELKEFIDGHVGRIENHVDKMIDKQDEIKSSISDMKVENAKQYTKLSINMDTLEAAYKRNIIDYDKLNAEVEAIKNNMAPILFLYRNPKLTKFAAVGLVTMFFFSIFTGYKAISEYVNREEVVKTIVEKPKLTK